MTKIEIVREDKKATAILKTLRLIDDGEEIEAVVRCKDCKHRTLDCIGGHCCRLYEGLAMVTDESFCSYGERKTY